MQKVDNISNISSLHCIDYYNYYAFLARLKCNIVPFLRHRWPLLIFILHALVGRGGGQNSKKKLESFRILTLKGTNAVTRLHLFMSLRQIATTTQRSYFATCLYQRQLQSTLKSSLEIQQDGQNTANYFYRLFGGGSPVMGLPV